MLNNTERIQEDSCEQKILEGINVKSSQVQVSNKIPVYATVSFASGSGIYYHNGILLSGIFIVCVSGFCIYRQLFCKVVTKIDAIKEHYTLSVPEQIDKDYIKYLCFILDMVDHTLDTEYSNQLMRKQAEFDSMKSQINPHFSIIRWIPYGVCSAGKRHRLQRI